MCAEYVALDMIYLLIMTSSIPESNFHLQRYGHKDN